MKEIKEMSDKMLAKYSKQDAVFLTESRVRQLQSAILDFLNPRHKSYNTFKYQCEFWEKVSEDIKKRDILL